MVTQTQTQRMSSDQLSAFAFVLLLTPYLTLMVMQTADVKCEQALGPVYTKRQRQGCNNAAMTLVTLFSFKSVESLENALQTHSGVTPLISMRMESLASSQSCCSLDADAWCKRTLNILTCTIFYHPTRANFKHLPLGYAVHTKW